MPLAAKAQFGQRVGGALIANEGTFPDQPVAGADLQDLAGAVLAAADDVEAMRAQLREKMTALADLAGQLDRALTQTGNYVQNVSRGDATIIGLAGLDFRKTPTPVGPLAAPRDVTIREGANAGTLALRWQPMAGAGSYRIERTTTESAPGSWNGVVYSTKAKALAEGLASGTRYWFRVAAVGAAGQGPWSDALGKIAP
jgi:hypothetical protein